MVFPAANVNVFCNAAQGSRPAPVRRDKVADFVGLPASAAGAEKLPSRPKNSVRSAVQAVCLPAKSAKVIRLGNAVFQGLRASKAPVSLSILAMINGAVVPRAAPST